MDTLHNWLEKHRGDILEFIRVYLGLVLIYKGTFFMNDTSTLAELMGFSTYASLAIAHYIVFSHIVGGFFLAIGFLTRTVVLFQIPVLMGAVLLVDPAAGFAGSREYALLVLFLLVSFGFYGSGRLSVDYYLEHGRAERETLAHHHHHAPHHDYHPTH